MKTKILLVEDEAALADSLTTEFELELDNVEVIWAKDGLEALDKFRDNRAKHGLIAGLDATAP